jgi:hypothetical protein
MLVGATTQPSTRRFSRAVTCGGGSSGSAVLAAGTSTGVSSRPVETGWEILVQMRAKRTGELQRRVPRGVRI